MNTLDTLWKKYFPDLDIPNEELLDVVNMVDGLEYHYNNFLNHQEKELELLKKEYIEKRKFPVNHKSRHEVVAYINRLGLLLKIFESKWFLEYLGSENDLVKFCPVMLALSPFRNKCTAHRSKDYPLDMKENILEKDRLETDRQIKSQLRFFESNTYQLIGKKDVSEIYNDWGVKDVSEFIKNPKINNSDIPLSLEYFEKRLEGKYGRLYQIEISFKKHNRHKLLMNNKVEAIKDIEMFINNDYISVNFIPIKDHKLIMNEILSVMKKACRKRD